MRHCAMRHCAMRHCAMRHCAMRRCGKRRCFMRILPVPLRVPLRAPVLITLALVFGLCAACSGGPPRDHLDAAAIDAFFLPLIKAVREEAAAQQSQTPDLRKTR